MTGMPSLPTSTRSTRAETNVGILSLYTWDAPTTSQTEPTVKFKFHSVVLAGRAIIVEYDDAEVKDAYGEDGKFLWFSIEDFTMTGVDPGPAYATLFQAPGDRLFHETACAAEQDAHQYLM